MPRSNEKPYPAWLLADDHIDVTQLFTTMEEKLTEDVPDPHRSIWLNELGTGHQRTPVQV